MNDEKGDYQIGTLAGVTLRAHVCGSDANVLRALFKGLLASAEANRWISVEDRLPDDDREVLTVRAGRIPASPLFVSSIRIDSYLQAAHGGWVNEDEYRVPVTHWRELPASPAQMERQAAEILGTKEAAQA